MVGADPVQGFPAHGIWISTRHGIWNRPEERSTSDCNGEELDTCT
jgi:hypothetical protein